MLMDSCINVHESGVAICESEKISLAKKTSRLDCPYYIGMNLLKWLGCMILRFSIIFFCCFTHFIAVIEERIFAGIV